MAETEMLPWSAANK